MGMDMARVGVIEASDLLVEVVTICMGLRPFNVQMPTDSIHGHVI